MLTPTDMTRLSERIMRVTDVLCLSAVTIHGLVLEWLDAEGIDVRPCYKWVTRLLRGMRLSSKKPAKCLKELHSPEQQEANTHRFFIKLCWLMDKHAVGADRVVNIDETSCRLLPVHQTGWSRRGVKHAQQGNTKEATTFTVAFSMDRGSLDMLVQIVHAGKKDAVLPEQPWPERTHHVTSENGWATTTTILQLAAALDNMQRGTVVHPPLGHGQHPRQRGHPGRHAGHIPSHRARVPPATKHVVPTALRRGRLPQLQGAGEHHACLLRPRWLLRRLGHEQGMTAPADLCEKNLAWTTGWSRLRAHSNDEFEAAVAHATELHAEGELFSRHIEPEPAPEDPVDWFMAEATDGDDDAPMPDAPPEPELIDMPPAPASAPPTTNLERCIALRLVYGARPR